MKPRLFLLQTLLDLRLSFPNSDAEDEKGDGNGAIAYIVVKPLERGDRAERCSGTTGFCTFNAPNINSEHITRSQLFFI
ncbi:hypothetical protein [secondary endosymbiont of Ctenarytaina eucalypti]|uniref:Uncharacterized protein n=1 Tax=secondary endosymbiont of Ctenarytaina eucalypti TaxID=1199245 RepID=J3VSW6_9ENTR|nr:hypothetical protein [secondary endosymbiont of Ctenarytaina eucalypti]AFP85051.1 hypothetical protein A359_06650 [secondary endosymbiont of Ctenarytaina eucalypti]